MSDLTVVMAHAGDERFLEQTLRSLSQQTLEGFRVLLIDDASGADFEHARRRFTKLDLRVLHNSTRLGLAVSLNRGLRACETRFVARMDSDDTCAPDRLARQLKWLSERPDVAVLGTAVKYVDESGRDLSRTFPLTEPEDISLGLLAYNQLAHGSVMAKTESILLAGSYDESLRVSQDYDLWLRLSLSGQRLANLAEPLYEQRIHRASASAMYRRRQIVDARRIRDGRAGPAMQAELRAFFSGNRHVELGRPYERMQLGKLGLFVGYLAGRAGLPLGLRGRAFAFAARQAPAAVAALRAERAWRREWSRWMRMVLP